MLPVVANPYQQLLTRALADLGVQVVHLARLPRADWLRGNAGAVQVLHVHWLHQLYMARFATPVQVIRFISWLELARRLGYRLVWTAHNLLPHRRPLPPLHRAIRHWVVRRVDRIITHCRFASEELQRLYPSAAPVSVIPHGSFAGVYSGQVTKEAARRELGLGSGDLVYLFLGNIARYKGLDRLVTAFRRMEGDRIRLVIAGRDRDHRLVRRLRAAATADRRILLNAETIPDERMQVWLAVADVMVAPFVEILSSGSVIAGMSYGLPVIAPALGCLPELVTDQAGSLYDPRDSDGLGRALESARGWDVVGMGAAARAITDRLRWDEIAERTLAVYSSCGAGPRLRSTGRLR